LEVYSGRQYTYSSFPGLPFFFPLFIPEEWLRLILRNSPFSTFRKAVCKVASTLQFFPAFFFFFTSVDHFFGARPQNGFGFSPAVRFDSQFASLRPWLLAPPGTQLIVRPWFCFLFARDGLHRPPFFSHVGGPGPFLNSFRLNGSSISWGSTYNFPPPFFFFPSLGNPRVGSNFPLLSRSWGALLCEAFFPLD